MSEYTRDHSQRQPDVPNPMADCLLTVADQEMLIQQIEGAFDTTVADYLDGRISKEKLDEVLSALERARGSAKRNLAHNIHDLKGETRLQRLGTIARRVIS